jgi:hypothetical protein
MIPSLVTVSMSSLSPGLRRKFFPTLGNTTNQAIFQPLSISVRHRRRKDFDLDVILAEPLEGLRDISPIAIDISDARLYRRRRSAAFIVAAAAAARSRGYLAFPFCPEERQSMEISTVSALLSF